MDIPSEGIKTGGCEYHQGIFCLVIVSSSFLYVVLLESMKSSAVQ